MKFSWEKKTAHTHICARERTNQQTNERKSEWMWMKMNEWAAADDDNDDDDHVEAIQHTSNTKQ